MRLIELAPLVMMHARMISVRLGCLMWGLWMAASSNLWPLVSQCDSYRFRLDCP